MPTGYANEGQVSVGFGEHYEVLSERRAVWHVFFPCPLVRCVFHSLFFFLFDGSVERRVSFPSSACGNWIVRNRFCKAFGGEERKEFSWPARVSA